MTEISTTAVHLEPSLATAAVPTIDANLTNGTPTEEEGDSQIKCICGFEDDDGNTVLCEDCQTWQHIECFYPGKTPDDLPEHHFCNNCRPRSSLDGKAAAERQRLSRTVAPSEKKKKAPTKPRMPTTTSKKKIKETSNGISHPDMAYSHDRASGSPHDPPPAKKAKTSHRQSASVTNITLPQPGGSRKRTNSVATAQLSPTKSPSSPLVNGQSDQILSPDFMTLYDNDYTQTTTNSYKNISFLDTLSQWLDDPNELGIVTNGKTHNDVFKTWSKPWSELEDASPGLAKTRTEDKGTLAHGRHPVYEFLTVKSYTPSGAFIGELNGVIGKIEEYCQESSRWASLKHPEPFVFFHDKLPICIDARKEGSMLRFLRRSCRPNLSIQIIIVDREYRFCFVSSQEIHEGEEATIGWNLTETGLRCATKLLQEKPFTADESVEIITWVNGIFSNFGSCACEDKSLCSLENLRLKALHYLNSKQSRRKGNKKSANQPSPFGTGRATNSRAGSEAVNQAEMEEEAAESPSATGSGRSKPSSRDITPAQPGSEAFIGLGVELSSREQRKLQQQERLFEKMETDGSKGRKRNSGGSALSTPTVTTSKQLHDPVNPSPPSSSNKQPRTNGRIEKKQRRSLPNGVSNSERILAGRPSYTESSTQTEESTSPKLSEAERQLFERRKQVGCSYAMKLLRRTRRQRFKLNSNSPTPNGYSASPSPVLQSVSPVETKPDISSKEMPPPPLPVHAGTKTENGSPPAVAALDDQDVEMKDADIQTPAAEAKTPSPNLDQKSFAVGTQSPLLQTVELVNETIQAPLNDSTTEQPQFESFHPSKPVLSVPMPPPPSFTKLPLQSPGSTPTTPGAFGALTPGSVPPTTPGVATTSPTLVQSPTAFQATQPLTSPQLTNVAASTPVKKKLSLSDYTKRKKTEAAKDAVQPSPLAATTPLSIIPDSEKSEGKDQDLSAQPDSATESPTLPFSDKAVQPPESEPTPMDVDPKLEPKLEATEA